MAKILLKLSLLIGFGLVFTLIYFPEGAQAQWPPFDFRVTPSFENGKIKYTIRFSSEVEWNITNLTFKIPLPNGTRFLEADAQATTQTKYSGTEVEFSTAVFDRPIKDASFVVEVIDPGVKVFTTRAWVGWQGDQPGEYLVEDITIDTTKQPLNWEAPGRSHLQLQAKAIVSENVVTYLLYPKNVGQSNIRMQDLKINIPLPEGTKYLSAEVPPTFVAKFDGREVSFTTLELVRGAVVGPLSFKISTEGVSAPVIKTHAWASWKNAGKKVGVTIVQQEDTVTGDLAVQPHASQWVVADIQGDVSQTGYDVTSIALQAVTLPTNDQALKIIFNLAGEIGRVGAPLEYTLYLDNDCRADTGKLQGQLGAEYQIRYSHHDGRAILKLWDEKAKVWKRGDKASSLARADNVTIWIPYALLQDGQQFCWFVITHNRTTDFYPQPPPDRAPDSADNDFLKYEALAPDAETDLPLTTPAGVKRTTGTFINANDPWKYLPGWLETPANWQVVDFDDSEWFEGVMRLGYGKGKFVTDLSLLTPESNAPIPVPAAGDSVKSVLLRRIFDVNDPAMLTQLKLKVRAQDGFVAYLNGVEVARRGLGAPNVAISFDQFADTKANEMEDIDLSAHIPSLVDGVNVLALQVHRAAKSVTLAVVSRLTWAGNNAASVSEASDDPPTAANVATLPAPPSLDDVQGKIAVPIDNGKVAYDIHIFSMPDSKETLMIPNARQPHFRFDGQRLLINREAGGIENLFEYDFTNGIEHQVSDAPRDAHPFYDPAGNRVVYGNDELTVGKPEKVYNKEEGKYYYSGVRKPFIFVQCGLLPPHQEKEQRCRDIPTLGVLVPANQVGEIQGSNPVWTSNDMIAYKGCNSWAGSRLCGIYMVPSASTKGLSDGFNPRQVTRDTTDIPSDTKGNLLAFTSQRDGNWEAYVMNLDGQGVKNLSNSSDSNDGLPTISPDGNWVAFVSDRDGHWAIWVTPVIGGASHKLFDLPATVPWGDGDRAWTNERISWGP